MPSRPHHPHPFRRFFMEPRTSKPDPFMFFASIVVAVAWFFMAFWIDLPLGKFATMCFGIAFLCEGSADMLRERRGMLATSLRCLGGSLLIIAALSSLGIVFKLTH